MIVRTIAEASFRSTVIAAVALVLAAAAGATPTRSPAQSGPSPSSTPLSVGSPSAGPSAGQSIASLLTGKILFTRAYTLDDVRSGAETLFVANADGSDEARFGRPLTYGPRWSWDGTQLLEGLIMGEQGTTCIYDADGTFVSCVPLPASNDLSLNPGTWSPDGSQIAFEGKGAATGLYVSNLDGSDLRRLTMFHSYPADFTPDGEQVAYLVQLPGTPSSGNEVFDAGAVYISNVDGTGNPRAITPRDLPVEWTAAAPRLSHDGQWLVFASLGDIWKIRLDGTDQTKLFHDPDGGHAFAPTWSPDSQAILFLLDPPQTDPNSDEPPPYPNSLVVMRADGSDATPIITTPDWKLEPDWAP